MVKKKKGDWGNSFPQPCSASVANAPRHIRRLHHLPLAGGHLEHRQRPLHLPVRAEAQRTVGAQHQLAHRHLRHGVRLAAHRARREGRRIIGHARDARRPFAEGRGIAAVELRAGGRVATVVVARVLHPSVGELGTPMMGGRTTYNHTPSDLKHYCMARNNTVNLREYRGWPHVLMFWVKTVWFYTLTRPQPGRVALSARAAVAGLRGRFDGHRRYLR